MATPEVGYTLDDGTIVQFEIEPGAGFVAAGSRDKVVGRIREAVAPAVEGAHVVLDALKQVGPDEIALKFGFKVTGEMNWVVAKATTEGNFEVTMTWKPGGTSPAGG